MGRGQPVAEGLRAADIIAALKRAGVRFIVALPDRQTTEGLMKPMLEDPDFRVVQVCKEDEGLSICSGLYAAGHRSVLMMQYTGLLDSVNAIRGVAVLGRNPVCMIVGLLNKEPGVPPAQSGKYGVRVVEPVLDAMGVAHHWVEAPDDVARIVPAIDKAYDESASVALLVGVPPR